MSAKKKRQDSLKAKEKKQKIIAGVGGVLLLGLLAFQVPRVMKQMHRGSASAAVPQTVSTPTTTPSLEAPTTLGQGTGTTSTASGSTGTVAGGSGLITSSSGGATEGRLASFSRFQSKDPFSQQMQSSSSSTGSGSTSGSGGSGGTAGSGSSASGGGSGSGVTGSPGTSPTPMTAVISVNGTLMTVTVGSDFPQPSASAPSATPMFHLVSLTSSTAKISIAGGTYTSGAPTVTLRVNKPVTLMNTADGSRFKLILKPQGTPVPGESSTGTGTSTTPTVTLPSPSP